MLYFKYIIVAIIGYFIGNISFAKIISKYKLKDDITAKGSGNPGTMNMYRNFGTKIGALTLVLDVLKGAIPAVIGMLVFGLTEPGGVYEGYKLTVNACSGLFVAGAATVFGHCYPVIYKFKGGKGVATTLGVFLVANPTLISIAFIGLIVLLLVFEYGGVASIVTVAAAVCWQAHLYPGCYIVLSCLLIIFVLVWFAHRKNILKTLTGEESKTDIRKIFKPKKKQNS